jgi:Zn-dependent protease with chaperone function
VLFDTLLNSNLLDEEIIALVSHEIGNCELSHVAKEICFRTVEAIFYLGFLYHILGNPHYERAFGFYYWKNEQEHFIYLFLMSIMLEPYRFFIKLLKKYINRKNVIAADEYAINQGNGRNLCNALVKL